MENNKGCILGVILLLVLFAVFGLTCLTGLIFMGLWNIVMPIFGITALSFWKAWALHLLIGIIANAFNGSYPSRIEKLKEDLRKLNDSIKTATNTPNVTDATKETVETKTDKPKKPRRRKSKKSTNNDNSPT